MCVFVVTERPVIRDIKYEGAKSVSTSDILDRFKERKVGLTVESMYDPNVVNHAAVVLKELLAEHGHQFAMVTPELRRIPPSSLEVVFNVVEGPKIKVGRNHDPRQQGFHPARSHTRDEESASDRDSAFASSSNICFPSPSTPRSSKKIKSASATLIRRKATSPPRPSIRP